MSGAITVVSSDGRLVQQVTTPDVYTTNICFGGGDRKAAYITLSGIGQLVSVPWKRPGLKLNFAPSSLRSRRDAQDLTPTRLFASALWQR
jgi:gluconolactonase